MYDVNRYLSVFILGVWSLLNPGLSISAVQIYAHRGTRLYFPENSIPAYEFAIRMGADWLDADLRLTKDGHIVIFHDGVLSSSYVKDINNQWVTSSLAIEDLTLAQLKDFTLSSPKPGSSLAKLFPYVDATSAIKIPTLAEAIQVLDQFAGHPVKWQLELKTNATGLDRDNYRMITTKVVEFIQSHHMQDRVELQAFDWRVIKLVHHLDPHIHTAALLSSDTVSFKRIDSPLDGIWTAGLKPQDFDWNYAKMAASLGATCFEPYEMEVSRTMVQQAHDLGMKVVTWHWAEKQGVWSDWKRTHQLLGWGVEGLIVDDLANIEAILAQLHQSNSKDSECRTYRFK